MSQTFSHADTFISSDKKSIQHIGDNRFLIDRKYYQILHLDRNIYHKNNTYIYYKI
jgi:hypothetical protein